MESRVVLSTSGVLDPAVIDGLVEAEPEQILNHDPEITRLAIAPENVRENGIAVLRGQFTDPDRGDRHKVAIRWGDGTGQVLALAQGQREFVARHRYADDDPSGTARDEFKVGVTVSDNAGGSDFDSVAGVVYNVAPEITAFRVTPRQLENGVVRLWGKFTDPGRPDVHTVFINWGDGTQERMTLRPGSRAFAGRHIYQDDDPSGTPADRYMVRVVVADDDLGRDRAEAQTVIRNVRPEITSLVVRPIDVSPAAELAAAEASPAEVAPDVSPLPVIPTIDENGVVVLKGKFRDPGALDNHTVVVHWGDGTAERWQLDEGQREFFRRHQYLDDPGPNSTDNVRDLYRIRVMVIDDDLGRDVEWTPVIVHNVAPEITEFRAVTPDPGNVDPLTTVGIFGAFTDVGTLDTHRAFVEWGDGTSSSVNVTEEGGAGRFLGRHAYRAPGVYEIVVTLRDDDGGVVRDAIRVIVPPLGPVDHQPQALSAALADWSLFD